MPTQKTDIYDPYINSLFDIGHKFRKRVSQKEMSNNEFRTHTSSDIMMKNSTFSSTSIRSVESQSALNLAKSTLNKLEPLHSPYGRNPDIRIHLNTLESDLDFKSPKSITKNRVISDRYGKQSKSVKRFNIDVKLGEFDSTRSAEG